MTVVDRSGLRPEIREMLEAIDRENPPPAEEQSPQEARAGAETAIPALWGPVEPVASVEDISIGAEAMLVARIYRPAESRGTVLFFHGGGWLMGSIDTHDGPCRRLANTVPCALVSVGYRKAPEHPFPAAVDDADEALAWLVGHGGEIGLDNSAIIVAGESAGANLAAVLARHARDEHIALGGQMLVQPVTDLAMNTDSYRAFATGFRLTAASMEWLARHYLPAGVRRDHPDASPLKAADLSGVAPAFIVTGEYDPLRDERRAYAARLIEAGTDVTYVEWPGVVHGFFVMNAITPTAAELISRAAAWARSRFAAATMRA